MITKTVLLSLAGLIASLYAYYVERALKKDSLHKPLCDVNDRMSCSKAFLSPYGSFLGISTAFVGISFYSVLIILAAFNFATLVFYASIAAFLATLLFMYLLYFKVKTFCFICTTIYIINILLFITNVF